MTTTKYIQNYYINNTNINAKMYNKSEVEDCILNW